MYVRPLAQRLGCSHCRIKGFCLDQHPMHQSGMKLEEVILCCTSQAWGVIIHHMSSWWGQGQGWTLLRKSFIDSLLGSILENYLLRQVHAKTSSPRDLHYKVQIERDHLCSSGQLALIRASDELGQVRKVTFCLKGAFTPLRGQHGWCTSKNHQWVGERALPNG